MIKVIVKNTIGYYCLSISLFHRTDKRKTRLTGALCGLGWDDTNHGPMLPEHDMEVTFDTKVTTENIKQVRHYMSRRRLKGGLCRSKSKFIY